MRILITGSSGMLGRELCMQFARRHDVIGLDIAESAISGMKDFIQADIADDKAVLRRISGVKPDMVIHCAAWTDVDGAEIDPEIASRVNTEGTRFVAMACKDSGSLLIFMSTDFVFDGQSQSPYAEGDATDPTNVYGRSKLEAEKLTAEILDRFVIVRTSWLFGPGGRNFVDVVLNKAREEKILEVVTDQFGSPTYTCDISGALAGLAENHLKDLQGIYHITNSENCSWYKFAEEILKCSNLTDVELKPITSEELHRAAERPRMCILSNKRYAELTGETLRPWHEALKEYLTKEKVKI